LLNRLACTALFVLLSASAHAISTTALVAHWPLDGNGSDASGNGNDLAAIDVASGTDRFGNAAAAVELNAATSSLSLGDGPASDLTTQFTWAGWIRFDRIGSDTDVIAQKSCCSSNVTTMFYADTYAYDGSQPRYNQIRFFVANGGGNFGFEHAGPILQNHTWYHLALVYDGPHRTMQVYVNGVLTDWLTYSGAGGIADVPSSLNDCDAPLAMGREPGAGPTNSLQGALDDVWWFARVLTPAEIAELAGAPSCEQQVQQLQAQVAALTAANAALSQQLQSVANGVQSVQSAMRAAFGNPQFTIPGSTPVEQQQSLIQAILALNRGQLQVLYRSLGGK
jgi:Concanavalin A-like lectin/glucanases superfamily